MYKLKQFRSKWIERQNRKQKLIRKGLKNTNILKSHHLLAWAMFQMKRAALDLDLLTASSAPEVNLSGAGCECVAKAILKKLVKSKVGWNLVKEIDPSLLIHYKKP